MNLTSALKQIAADSGLDTKKLLSYAKEDQVSGCEDGHFSSISVCRDEGRILYALIRAMRPALVVEIGSYSGCSATHILTAMEQNNFGQLLSIDINGIQPPGIPAGLQHRWSIIEADAQLCAWPEHVDFVFEDGDHMQEFTHKMVAKSHQRGAKAILSHDAYNASVGECVRAGFGEVLPDYKTLMIDDFTLGFAYWFRSEG